MKIAIGNDHAAIEHKNELVELMQQWGHEVVDCGIGAGEAIDYPDISVEVCKRVLKDCVYGVVLCGTGIGVSIAANKIPGIRCAHCTEGFSAEMARAHNNANVLAMGARTTGIELCAHILDIFLHTEFSATERANRRVGKLDQLL